MDTQPVITDLDWTKEENMLLAVNSAKLMRRLGQDAIDTVADTYQSFLNRTRPEATWRVSRAFNGRLKVNAEPKRR